MSNAKHTILFAGGGTGGHIYPNVAVWERLAASRFECGAQFLISDRPHDTEMLAKRDLLHTPLPAQPFRLSRPWTLPGFANAHQQSIAICRGFLKQLPVAAVISTGGFAAAPAVVAASQVGLPIALINLDAVPGKANRMMARRATQLFTVYPIANWPDARPIGLPLPESSIGPDDPAEARQNLGLDPARNTLLITGGSQGAESINRMVIELLGLTHARQALGDWQVLHLSGPGAAETAIEDRLTALYRNVNIPARVETFCNAMGSAWRAATIAIARAGAGTVAEVWANATPTLFLPYPHHRDQHQRRNAQPLVDAGAATVITDLIDPFANARQIVGPLTSLIRNPAHREHMSTRMGETRPENGAESVARWVAQYLQ